jgi:DNA-binding MarR family transcriptional regulator
MTIMDASILAMVYNGVSQSGASRTDRVAFLRSQLGFHVAQRFAERLEALGLNPRHFGLLTHLSADNGQCEQQLADAMGIHRNAMVGLVDDLDGPGLVQRSRHPGDRRAHAVHLTPAARDLLAQAQAAAGELESDLVAALHEADRRQLISLLQRIAKRSELPPGVHPALRRRPAAPTPDEQIASAHGSAVPGQRAAGALQDEAD